MTAGAVASERVVWHDVECGAYRADLPLWLNLAEHEGADRILDVGAGTGRVALELARAGHGVIALDSDSLLLETLAERAAGLPVSTLCADARDFALDRPVELCLAPMQTIQLLGGRAGRAAFLERVRAHLEPGGLVAIAIADALEGFEGAPDPALAPDMRVVGDVVYASWPVAVRRRDEQVCIERVREVRDGSRRRRAHDVVCLDALDVETLLAEGEGAGLRAAGVRRIDETEEHVGSEVVMLRA
jgi:SAM-dependent methyltransferase